MGWILTLRTPTQSGTVDGTPIVNPEASDVHVRDVKNHLLVEWRDETPQQTPAARSQFDRLGACLLGAGKAREKLGQVEKALGK